jgi:hypothetical protein
MIAPLCLVSCPTHLTRREQAAASLVPVLSAVVEQALIDGQRAGCDLPAGATATGAATTRAPAQKFGPAPSPHTLGSLSLGLYSHAGNRSDRPSDVSSGTLRGMTSPKSQPMEIMLGTTIDLPEDEALTIEQRIRAAIYGATMYGWATPIRQGHRTVYVVPESWVLKRMQGPVSSPEAAQ